MKKLFSILLVFAFLFSVVEWHESHHESANASAGCDCCVQCCPSHHLPPLAPQVALSQRQPQARQYFPSLNVFHSVLKSDLIERPPIA